MRSAAGVCAVAGWLLMGLAFGPDAAAAPGSDPGATPGDSTTQADDAGGSNRLRTALPGTTAQDPVRPTTDVLRQAHSSATDTFGPGRTSSAPRSPDGHASPTTHHPQPGADGNDTDTSVADVFAPVPNALNPVGEVPAQATDSPSSVGDVVAPAVGAVMSAPVVIASAADRIDAAQLDLFAAAQGGVDALTQLPPGLSPLFGAAGLGPAAVRPVPPQGNAAPTPAAEAPVQAVTAQPPAVLPTPEVRVVGDAIATTPPPGVAPSSVSAASSVQPTAPAREDTLLHGLLQLARAAGEALKSMSLWELTVLALPGLGGLVLLFGAGVRIGHLQATAGAALRMSAVARFARRGPLGVVRSGSVVTLHRPTPGVRRFLEQAA